MSGGRPKLDDSEKLSHPIQFNVSKKDYKYLKKMSGSNFSGFIREKVLDTTLKTTNEKLEVLNLELNNKIHELENSITILSAIIKKFVMEIKLTEEEVKVVEQCL